MIPIRDKVISALPLGFPVFRQPEVMHDVEKYPPLTPTRAIIEMRFGHAMLQSSVSSQVPRCSGQIRALATWDMRRGLMELELTESGSGAPPCRTSQI